MTLIRREFLQVAGVLAVVPSATWTAFAQTAGPKLTQILKKDMEGQGLTVQETVVSIIEFGPGVSAPWHMHPSAQEMLYALDGNLVVEVDGRGTTSLKPGESAIIPGDVAHLARNDSSSASVKGLLVHSRGEKGKPFVVAVKR